MTREQAINSMISHGFTVEQAGEIFKAVTPQEPTTKNDLGVDCIDRAELLKAMDTWDKFGNDLNEGLIPLRTPALQDRYVPYVKYDDMVNCVKGMPSVTPQEPFINKLCVSEKICEHDKQKVLDKIRAEIIHESDSIWNKAIVIGMNRAIDILDKYKTESDG